MEQFKSGLSGVKDKLKLIQVKITEVDRNFYVNAQQTIGKQEEMIDLASKQTRLSKTRKFIVRVKKLD
jgi:hypothetical protein